jgi:hypothetical protein
MGVIRAAQNVLDQYDGQVAYVSTVEVMERLRLVLEKHRLEGRQRMALTRARKRDATPR